jgi:fucose 4-O-acetylase-like acetyltransferase
MVPYPSLPAVDQQRDPIEPDRRGTRVIQVDALRFLATLGVIWVHVAEYQGHKATATAFGRFGTAYYTAAAILIALYGADRKGARFGGPAVTRRARRLLLPFVVWSLVYAVLHAKYGLREGVTWSELGRWWGPLAGTAPHLWFLPFAFVVSLLAVAVGPALLRLRSRHLVAGVTVLIPSAYLATYLYTFPALDRAWLLRWHLHRLDRWVEEAPFVVACLGLIALWFREGADRVARATRSTRFVLVAMFAVLFIGVEVAFAFYGEELRQLTKSEGRFAAQAAGIALLGLALSLGGSSKLVRSAAWFGKHTYTIFLSHFLIIELANRHCWRLPGFGRLEFAVLSTIVVFAVGLGLSVLPAQGTRAVRALAQVRLRRLRPA